MSNYLQTFYLPAEDKSFHHGATLQILLSGLQMKEEGKMKSYDLTTVTTPLYLNARLNYQARFEQDNILSERIVCLQSKPLRFLRDVWHRLQWGRVLPVNSQGCNGICSVIKCLYLDNLEQRAIQNAPHATLWWYWYVDDTHTNLKKQYTEKFTNHLNSLVPDIKFTTKGEEGKAHIIHTPLFTRTAIKKLRSTGTRKPSYTDQYLNFQYNHSDQNKLG